MVSGHVVGNDGDSGLRVPDDSAWRYFYFTFAPFRMPLFTAISGFVYAMRPVNGRQWRQFATGKLRRLFVPLLVVGSAFVALQMVIPGTNDRLPTREIPSLLITPYAHFWYLYALGWVFLVVGTLDAFGALSRRWCLVLAIAAALAISGSGRLGTPLLGISHAEYLLPYFLLGVWARRFPPTSGWPFAIALVVPCMAGVILHQAYWFGRARSFAVEEYLVTTLVGATAVAAGLVHRVSWKPLAVLGPFSYGIYLMHVFGTAGSRIALRSLGLESLPALALAGLLAGVGLPIAIEKCVQRNPLLTLLVLGRRTRPVTAPRREPTALVRLRGPALSRHG